VLAEIKKTRLKSFIATRGQCECWERGIDTIEKGRKGSMENREQKSNKVQ
jgi:hypothetical protein